MTASNRTIPIFEVRILSAAPREIVEPKAQSAEHNQKSGGGFKRRSEWTGLRPNVSFKLVFKALPINSLTQTH